MGETKEKHPTEKNVKDYIEGNREFYDSIEDFKKAIPNIIEMLEERNEVEETQGTTNLIKFFEAVEEALIYY